MSAEPAPVRHVLVREPELTLLRDGTEPRHQIRYRLDDDGDLAVVSIRGRHVASVLRTAESTPDEADASALTLMVGPDGSLTATGLRAGVRTNVGVTTVPDSANVFDRLSGVFESALLRDKHVLCVGLGSGGSAVLRELVRSGVGRFTLVDHDRLEVANVCRHELGLGDVGRLKVLALRDYVLDRHPGADVTTHDLHIDGTSFQRLLEIVQETSPDVIICGTDNRESRLLINRVSLLTGTVAIYGGVRRRAYAGQVLRVVPHVTPCYQCFVRGLGAAAADVEVSSTGDADSVAYSDRPVVPEPGLSTDIAPVALLIAKLALLELTADQPTRTFDSLRKDLVASWFFWLNRREADTPYADWPPMRDVIDQPSVLQWMGQHLARADDCAACGTQEAEAVDPDEAALFGG